MERKEKARHTDKLQLLLFVVFVALLIAFIMFISPTYLNLDEGGLRPLTQFEKEVMALLSEQTQLLKSMDQQGDASRSRQKEKASNHKQGWVVSQRPDSLLDRSKVYATLYYNPSKNKGYGECLRVLIHSARIAGCRQPFVVMHLEPFDQLELVLGTQVIQQMQLLDVSFR